MVWVGGTHEEGEAKTSKVDGLYEELDSDAVIKSQGVWRPGMEETPFNGSICHLVLMVYVRKMIHTHAAEELYGTDSDTVIYFIFKVTYE